MLPFVPFKHAAFGPLEACFFPVQEAQLGIRRTSTIPVRFKQMVSDCLSPTTSSKPNRHHKLSEVDNVDTPPARLMSDPMPDQRGEEEVQSSHQQPAMTDGQSQPKRVRVTPVVRHMHAM